MVASRWSTTTRAESRVPPASVATTQAAPLATATTRPLSFTLTNVGSRESQV
jgi:hypothetical protein